MSKFNTTEAVNAEINATLALLDTEYNLDKTHRKNVVLFVGISGAGKSTLCQFLAGNPSLKAAQVNGTFYITDGNNKANESITESKILMPELVPIPNTETVLADFPSFGDNRSASHDIAAAVFTQQLLDKSQKVKIMVTVSRHSVQKSADRKGFIDLLAHVLEFVKDIEKYKDSIGLMVTKVENKSKEEANGVLIYISDEEIVNEIGSFLNIVKKELTHKSQNFNVTRKIQLIDALTTKSDKNEFSKIGIFRKPTKSGDPYTNARLLKNKQDMERIMNTSLNSSQVASNDFGLSLSADSKYIVTKMRETLNTKLSNILDEYISAYSRQTRESSDKDIDTIKTDTTRLIAIEDLLKVEIVPKMVVTNLMEQIHTLNPEHSAQQFYREWKHQQKYLQFLKSISPNTDDANDFNKYHTQLVDFKQKISNNVQLMRDNAETTIDQAIGEIIGQVMVAVKIETINQELSSPRPYSQLSEQVRNVYNSGKSFLANIKKSNTNFKQFSKDFKATFKLSKNQKEKLETLETDIDFFKRKMNASITDGHQDQWLQGFTMPLDDIKATSDWYSFIADAYSKLIDYDKQFVLTNNTRKLKNWSKFKVFHRNFRINRELDSYLESRVTLSGKEKTDLSNLVDAVTPSLTFTCQSSQLVVKGNLIKLKEIRTAGCSFKELYIFATQTVFFDASLIEPGKNVYIIAPMWRIIGKRLIDLKGLDATETGQGQAGDPGQPGGNFIGIGDDFVNGIDLTIDVSGGNGSNGMDGIDGQNGQNGLTPATPRHSIWYQNISTSYCNGPNEAVKISGIDGHCCSIYQLFGTNGTPGSRGGNGGIPGRGAKPGNILVNTLQFNKIENPGKNGVPGKGGKGGTGGDHGQTRYFQCSTETHHTLLRFWYTNIASECRGRAENGGDGISGVAGNLIDAAEPQSFESQTTVATQYKQYVQQGNSHFVDSLEFIDRYASDGYTRKRRSVSALCTPPVTANSNWMPQPLAIDHKSGNFEDMTLAWEFSMSSFVALADVLIRKLMKTQPSNVGAQTDPKWENLLVQAEVLKIVEQCEVKWNELNQDKIRQTPFDPLCLQKELTWRVWQLVDKSLVKQIEGDILRKCIA